MPAIPRYDPRIYQIFVLAILVIFGATFLSFDINAVNAAVILAVAAAVQLACSRIVCLGRYDLRSPLISGLSLIVLLRTNTWWLAACTAAVTIVSKFALRHNGKHIFNPTNFGLVFMMVVSDRVWVSPGQWGSAVLYVFFVACVGSFVVNRAARSDVTLAFLGSYAAILIIRALRLGDPMTIPFHQLQNGALLVFSFFMISDPKTTPDSRIGRIVFAFLVAVGAVWIQFGLYRINGFLWALAACAPLVPLLNRLFPGTTYQWRRPTC